MFFDPQKVLEQDFLLNFVVSERGGGKTFSTIKKCVEDFLNTGEQFVYCRRTAVELEECETKLMTPYHANDMFLNEKFSVKNKTIYINGKIAGHLIALSTAFQLKSVSYPKVTKIIFDEFISETGKYLKNEVEKFISLIETVARMRDISVILLGNQITIYNPYYIYLKIKPSTSEFTRYRNMSVLIYQFKSDEYRQAKLKTKFGKLISNTKYGNYLLNNEAINDDYSYIDKLEGISKTAIANLIIEGNNIVVYNCYLEDRLHMYFIRRKNINDLYTINYDEVLREGSSLESARNKPISKKIIEYIKEGRIRFKDIQAKNLIQNFIFN